MPRDILEVTLDSNELHSEIDFAVQNIYGYRAVLFDPYMVFEYLVKKQIIRLEEPVLMSIDSVVEQLTSAVRLSTQHVSNKYLYYL